jgi:hypothetical protein
MCLSAHSLFVSLSLCLRDCVFVLQATSCRLRGHPRQLLMVVALHEIKCGSLTLWRCKWNKDIVMCLSIALFLYLSVYIYIYIYISAVSLSFCLSVCPPGHIVQTKMTPSIFADGGAPSSNIVWCNEVREIWLHEEERRTGILWCI